MFFGSISFQETLLMLGSIETVLAISTKISKDFLFQDKMQTKIRINFIEFDFKTKQNSSEIF